MKSLQTITIIILISLLSGIKVYGQTSILKNINFDKGNWRLFGIAIGGEPSAIDDSLGDFLINDKAIFKQMQKTWKLEPYDGNQAGVGNYYLVFVNDKGDKIRWTLDFHRINITDFHHWYRFPPDLFYSLFNSLKKIPRTIYKEDSIDIARKVFIRVQALDYAYIYPTDNDSTRLTILGLSEIEIKNIVQGLK